MDDKMGRREAYDYFSDNLELIFDDEALQDMTSLESYLKDSRNPHRAELVSALADGDFPLSENLVLILAGLVANEDEDLAQSAALALSCGGAESNKILSDRIEELGPERRTRLAELLLIQTMA